MKALSTSIIFFCIFSFGLKLACEEIGTIAYAAEAAKVSSKKKNLSKSATNKKKPKNNTKRKAKLSSKKVSSQKAAKKARSAETSKSTNENIKSQRAESIVQESSKSNISSTVNSSENLVIRAQGSFFVGGGTIKKAGVYNPKVWMNQQGQTRHGDHAYIFYQIPVKPRKYAILFIHGAGQSGKCWETTPDGREGFQTLFLRQGYPVFIMDQPRMGRAGMGLHDGQVKVSNLDQFLFDINRLGVWPTFYKNVQFPRDEESLKQFYSQITPNTSGYNNAVISDAICRSLDSIEKIMRKTQEELKGIILITHSQSCCPGWYAAMKSDKIKAIVAIEPASGLPFSEKNWPGTIRSSSGVLTTNKVKTNDFLELTKLPIVLYFGDNIPNIDNHILGQDNWYQRLKMARNWVNLINKNGGKAQVVHLPEIGIHGNTHFMFLDKNNKKIAKLIFNWIEKL